MRMEKTMQTHRKRKEVSSANRPARSDAPARPEACPPLDESITAGVSLDEYIGEKQTYRMVGQPLRCHGRHCYGMSVQHVGDVVSFRIALPIDFVALWLDAGDTDEERAGHVTVTVTTPMLCCAQGYTEERGIIREACFSSQTTEGTAARYAIATSRTLDEPTTLDVSLRVSEHETRLAGIFVYEVSIAHDRRPTRRGVARSVPTIVTEAACDARALSLLLQYGFRERTKVSQPVFSPLFVTRAHAGSLLRRIAKPNRSR